MKILARSSDTSDWSALCFCSSAAYLPSQSNVSSEDLFDCLIGDLAPTGEEGDAVILDGDAEEDDSLVKQADSTIEITRVSGGGEGGKLKN